MKKSIIILLTGLVAFVSCNKEQSKSSGDGGPVNPAPMQVSVVNSSNSIAHPESVYPASDSIPVHFDQAADTTVWWICNPASGSSDSSIYPGDTTWIPVYIPPPVVSSPPPSDSTGNPGDTVAVVYPPAQPLPPPPIVIQPPIPSDSTSNPADTSRAANMVFYSALQQDVNQYACRIVNNGNLNLKINSPGQYQILVGTYSQNKDGSFTLVRTGFISFFAK